MISSSRGGHIGFFLIEKGPSPTSTFGCADGNRVHIYVSITNTGVISILKFNEVAAAILDLVFWKLLGAVVSLAPLAKPMFI